MKNIFKNILKLTFICLLTLLSSCEAEKDFTKKNKLIVRKFSMNDVAKKGNPKLVEVVNKVKNINALQTNTNAKIVFDEKSGFYFDDEKGVYIEMNNIKSYTFPIIRTSVLEKVKNICFEEKSNGNYDAYIIKYDFTKEEAANLSNEELINKEKKIVALVKDGEYVINPFNYVCVELLAAVDVEPYPVDHGDLTGNNGNQGGAIQWVTIFEACYEEGGGDTGTDGFNGGLGDGVDTGNNTGGGISDDDGIITGTIISDTEAQIPGSLPLGWRIQYFEDSLDEFSRPIYNQHPEIRDYLAFNNCNYSSQQSVLEMIGAVLNGDVVDFAKRITYGINKPCQKQIVKDLVDSCSPFTELIQQTFDSNENANIIFSNETFTGNNADANAITGSTPSSTAQNVTMKIKFNDSFLNTATDLAIVADTLHELVHAYLTNLYLKGNLIATNSNYNTLLNAFITFYGNKNADTFGTLDVQMHNAMIDFISKMANSIYNYALSKNITVTADYCEKLAWGTMYGTDLFTNVLTTEQQQQYGNTFAYEQDNLPAAIGTPCN